MEGSIDGAGGNHVHPDAELGQVLGQGTGIALHRRNARLATCAIGSSKPVYATSLGKVILAYLPREEQLSIIDKIKFVPFTPYTIVSKDDLLKELDSIRQKGYATENRELGEFTFCYGVPVFDHKENVIASISFSDIALSDQDASEIVADLKAAASEISKTADYTLR